MSSLALQLIEKEIEERTGRLDLSECSDLSKLPDVVIDLKWLKAINLSGVPINDISPLSDLVNLEKINCSNTKIYDISPLLRLLTSKPFEIQAEKKSAGGFSDIFEDVFGDIFGKDVCKLDVRNCQLVVPPVEFAVEGYDAVMEYFDQLGKNSKNLNEVKIIFLGDGAAGKTSLIKRLRGESFNPEEDQTHGIRIHKSSFKLNGERAFVRFWDFGGQEVMHATHQFFLSHRCLYVLVLNSRTDDKAEYWLKHVSSFGGSSPVLVVLNKIDENPSFDVNRKVLREKYSQIQGYYRLSCQSGQGIKEFREALLNEVNRSDIYRTPFPASWLNVRKYFSEMQQNYIESDEYQQICEKHRVKRAFSQDVLLHFLHDLGVVINFRNLKNFDTQILNPLWLTNGVYRIINSALVFENKGLLNENDFDAIINDPRYDPRSSTDQIFRYPRSKLSYIVRVMQEFELCFQLDATSFIVPQLLPIKEPDFNLNGSVLHFVVRFPEFLPDSIFPRLMVKLHGFIKGDLRWRSGMVLSKPNVFRAEARIRADREEKKISMDVCGEEPRRLLSFIRETLKEIIKDFTDLPFEELVPIPGSKEYLDYQGLVEAEKADEKEIFVWQIRKRISVEDLLNGVEEPSMREAIAQIPVKAFISYSRKDYLHLRALQAALSPLVRLDNLRLWYDRDIEAGDIWEDTIMTQLKDADIVLCLVSHDFIQSEFCYKREFLAALEAHRRLEKTIVPVRLRSCAYEKLPLAAIQGIPDSWITSSTNQDEAWTEVAKELNSAIEQARKRKQEQIINERKDKLSMNVRTNIDFERFEFFKTTNDEENPHLTMTTRKSLFKRLIEIFSYRKGG